ncbi:MAG: ECF-type sigma factor, partial [Fuerstiella sp.]
MEQNTTQLQLVFSRMAAGDVSARKFLIDHTYDRLRLLAAKMLSGFPGVRRWEETDDVLQRALIRLCDSLDHVEVDDIDGFFRFAATQMRRELIDLARHYY